MGSGPSALSKTSTVEDVANSLGSLGPAYEIYRRVVTDNGINYIAIMSLRTKEEIEVMYTISLLCYDITASFIYTLCIKHLDAASFLENGLMIFYA